MPKRQSNSIRVEGGPQGEDAFVIIKRMTLGEQETFGKLFVTAQAQTTEEQADIVRKAIADIVTSWNWVKNDDSPFPQPYQNPSIIGELYTNELEWIVNAITGNTDDQKKDLMPMPKL